MDYGAPGAASSTYLHRVTGHLTLVATTASWQEPISVIVKVEWPSMAVEQANRSRKAARLVLILKA